MGPILPALATLGSPGETYLLERLSNREHLDRFLQTFCEAKTGEILLGQDFNRLAQFVMQNETFCFSEWEIELIITSLTGGGEAGDHAKITEEVGLPTAQLLYFDAIYEWLCPGPPQLL